MGQSPSPTTKEDSELGYLSQFKIDEENQKDIHDDSNDFYNNYFDRYIEKSIADINFGKKSILADLNSKFNSDKYEYPNNDDNEKSKRNIKEEKMEKEKLDLSENKPYQKKKKRKAKKDEEYRLEDFLKILLTIIFNYIISELREKVKNCTNFNNMHISFHLTNYKKYQGKPTKANIKRIFQKKLKDALCDFNKNCFEGITHQKSNKTFIDLIYKREDFPSNQKEIELKEYLEMKIIDLIKKFYDDELEELIDLRDQYKNWDEIFFKEKKKKKGFYLLQDYGIIKYAQMIDPLFKQLVDEGRFLLRQCNFENLEEFKGIKLLFVSPNKYPKNRDVTNNPNLLQKKIKDVLIGEKDINLKKNQIIIEIFYYLINVKKIALTEEVINLKLFLEMTIQEYINKNYKASDSVIL